GRTPAAARVPRGLSRRRGAPAVVRSRMRRGRAHRPRQRQLAPARRAGSGARDAGAALSHRCGTVALVGRPNTGKSSLLNRLIGEKLSIVSARPQTTRHLITGILTRPDCQYVFVDAPGNPPRLKSVLHKALNRRVGEVASQADVVLFVVEALRFGPEDHAALGRIPAGQHAVAVVNKVDTVRRRADLIPFLDRLGKTREFAALVPVSAKSGKNVPELLRVI